MSDLRFDRRMSDAEGLMWRLEKDPHLSPNFATVTVLDRPPDFERFRRRMDRATQAIPRLRQRVQSAPANLSPPVWVDDGDFDLDRHLRRIALPKPGSIRQLLDLASLLVADPFDRLRPLWQFTVIEGLRGGKAALVEKLHHSITDGERGVELSLQFLDFERDAAEPEPITHADGDDDRDDHGEADDASSAELVRDFLAGGLRLPIGVARQVRDLLADPAQIPGASGAAAATLRGIVSQLSDTERARSPLWTERSLRRRLDVASAPFHETREAAHRLGGTLNTAFVTAVTHAVAQYHRQLGEPIESLRASMAISTRTEQSGSNAFSLVRMLVPTAEMPIEERFAAIHEATTVARHEQPGAGLETLAALASGLPTSLVSRVVRQQSQTVDFATSNVRGAPVPLFIAGAQLLQNYPVGPLLGTACNVTMLSYLGNLDIGINTDAAAVAEPELLTECLDKAFAALAAV